jgi:flagellar biosynthetic protein FlhB
MAGEKTEKATPKKLDEARQKGQVPRSIDFNGVAVLFAALIALTAAGPPLLNRTQEATVTILQLVASPEVVTRANLGTLLGQLGRHVGLALAPLLGACLVAGVVANVLQTGGKPAPKALKPQFGKLNPLQGFKQLVSPNSLVEALKSLLKVVIVGGVAAVVLLPRLDTLAALVGMPAPDLVGALASDVMRLARAVAVAYLALALADLVWQRYRHGKQMRMDKQEVKDEFKNTDLPPEVKGALRRRAMEAARARMMDAVPTADVVVTNPTHYSVALRYDAGNHAPVVVAKGKDYIALKIREAARSAGVAVVPDPPLARALHASVEVGQMIPEELYQAVAQLLAYVYRVAGRRAAAATTAGAAA